MASRDRTQQQLMRRCRTALVRIKRVASRDPPPCPETPPRSWERWCQGEKALSWDSACPGRLAESHDLKVFWLEDLYFTQRTNSARTQNLVGSIAFLQPLCELASKHTLVYSKRERETEREGITKWCAAHM